MQLLPVPTSRLPRPRAGDDETSAPNVPLHSPVVAMPRCGVYVTLRSMADASGFLRQHLMGDRANQLDCIRTGRLLDLAATAPTHGLRQAATVALRDLLRGENMLG